ncbi:MAG: cell division protein DivIVA [Desulfuromonas sp.]|nr:MAG: cell division protein DivIVA [Desulfuromonas sp.]
MPISPIDIQQQQFRNRPFGYERASVDQFLEMLAEEMERLIRQNNDLREELARTRTSLEQLQQRETTLKEALFTAQKVTNQLKESARQEADAMMAHAELRAERLLNKTEERRLELIGELQEIKRQKIDFETSLRALLEKHVRMLGDEGMLLTGSVTARMIESSATRPAAIPAKTSVANKAAISPEKPSAAAAAKTGSAHGQTTQTTSVKSDDLTFDLTFDYNGDFSDTEQDPFR